MQRRRASISFLIRLRPRNSLFERVSELKQDTDAMHTAEIFSVKVYKQTGEIEHLAKKLRNLAKS